MKKKKANDFIVKIIMGIVMAIFFVLAIKSIYEQAYKSKPTSIQIDQQDVKINLEELIPLKMYVIGEKPLDFELVLTEANALLNDTIGVQLSVEFISKKDVPIDYQTIFAGGADFDLITIYPYYYNVFASKYAYMNLTEDMLRKCTPQLIMSELDKVRVNQRIYAVPSNAHLENAIVLLIRGDLAKGYRMEDITTLEELEYYMRLVKNNEENIIPFDVGLSGLDLVQLLCTQPNQIQIYDNYWIGIDESKKANKVLWLPETSYFRKYLKTIKQWKDYGYIPNNASSKKVVLNESFLAGNSAIAIGNIFDMENLKREVVQLYPEYEPKIVTLGSKKISSYYEPIHNGIAIKNGAQYAAKSLMFVEQLRTNQTLFRLLNYGLKGKHYTISEQGSYIPLEESYKYPIYNNSIWCMTDQFRLSYSFESPNIITYNEMKEKAPMVAVSMDFEQLELSNLELIQQTYFYPLSLGSYDNMEGAIKSYVNQMEQAGFRSYLNQIKKTHQ
ncbi:MAG: hypothetical protein CVV02_11160 [Firmicutes bacterium HGW-Firmicutes-7]|nr:MAG: hypothetical protein CVV02_11160 [Firmicutes bacterium HGW-Firmicutes-7]